MSNILQKYTARLAPEVGAGSGTDMGTGSFGSIHEALGSYDEKAGPEHLLDDDAEDGDDGQGDRRIRSDDAGEGDATQQRSEQQQDDDQDDLEKLLAGLDPEGGSEGEEGEGQGDQSQQPQTLQDDHMVRLQDGTTVRYGDIRRQAAEIGEKATQVEQRELQTEQVRGQLRQQYEAMQNDMQLLAAVAQALMPQEPDIGMLGVDSNGYHILKSAYDKQAAMIGQIVGRFQQNQQQASEQAKAAREEFRLAEARKLVQRDPRFGQDDYWNAFQRDLFSYGTRVYGYKAEELREGMLDSRQFEVFRDALEYQKIKAAVKARKGVKVHQDARQRLQPRNAANGQYLSPQGRVVTGSGVRGRVDPKDMQRQAAEARFKKSPTLKNAVDLVD